MGRSYAHGINDLGQVVGEWHCCQGQIRGFLWDNGNLMDLGFYGSINMRRINNLGHAVGWTFLDGATRGFTWRDGVFTDLGHLPPPLHLYTYVRDINDDDQIVGWSHCPSCAPQESERAFLWDDGVMTDLGDLGYCGAAAFGINNLGQVVGRAHGPPTQWDSCPSLPFLWEDGVMTDLGIEWDDAQIQAFGITNGGSILASLLGVPTSLLVRGNEIIPLEYAATALNEQDQVVGYRYIGEGRYQAWLWVEGSLYPLDSLVPCNSGWELHYADDINEVGQIVGTGLHNGVERGFLLRPVGSRCVGDLDGDRTVALPDLALLLSVFGANNCGDLTYDGRTDLTDLAVLLGHFGDSCR